MKQIFLVLALTLSALVAIAQQQPTDLDKSPLDISYYPSNYPILKMRSQITGEPLARIIYSRPQKKGREIFGGEVKYNEVWRLGANEATELELFKTANIGGKRIPRGRYTLYCIPTETTWTLIINKDNYSWGSFIYKEEKDYARIELPVQSTASTIEALTIYFDSNSLQMMWDNVKVEVPVRF